MGILKKIIKRIIIIIDKIGQKDILVLGDSHAQVFTFPLFKLYFPFIRFSVCSIGGATASGLENPNSKTQAYNKFENKLNKKKWDYIIILLGEVDTGFVIWYRAEKYKVPVTKMFLQAIDRYTNFIKKAKQYGSVIVISTPLPTITDDNDWGEVANLRKEVKAKQKDKTELTIKFNKNIEKYCLFNNIFYINLDKDSMGENGLVKKTLLDNNKLDHHYNKVAYTKLISSKLKKLL